MRDLGVGVSVLLAFLLCVLSPQGTGQGVHRDQLLDWVLPHVHLDAPPAPVSHPRSLGVALGAGSAAPTVTLGLDLTPFPPEWPSASLSIVTGALEDAAAVDPTK